MPVRRWIAVRRPVEGGAAVRKGAGCMIRRAGCESCCWWWLSLLHCACHCWAWSTVSTCRELPSAQAALPPPVATWSPNAARRHGRGKFSAGSYKYEGEWREDRQHGSGVCQTDAGDKYVGAFQLERGRRGCAGGDQASQGEVRHLFGWLCC